MENLTSINAALTQHRQDLIPPGQCFCVQLCWRGRIHLIPDKHALRALLCKNELRNQTPVGQAALKVMQAPGKSSRSITGFRGASPSRVAVRSDCSITDRPPASSATRISAGLTRKLVASSFARAKRGRVSVTNLRVGPAQAKPS